MGLESDFTEGLQGTRLPVFDLVTDGSPGIRLRPVSRELEELFEAELEELEELLDIISN